MDKKTEPKQGIIVFASSNKTGNTAKLVESFNKLGEFEIIDLTELNIAFFDYGQKDKNDDFLPTIKTILDYQNIIFASPVYWYSMSAQMKVFFDRFSDILSAEKELAGKFREKNAYILATGFDDKPKRSFEEVFRNSFNYLGINYQGMLYAACPTGFDLKENQEMITGFYHEHFN